MDSNWRWTHNVGGYTNCYDGDHWNSGFCPDNDTCAEKCALDGVDQGTWSDTYGVHVEGNAATLNFVTQGPYSKNVGSRFYLLADEESYEMFQLVNREFTFDVDVSNLPCGLNGALYFSQMSSDGDKGGHNQAGAKYGTGYCDA
jgi:cellulose 1,4-beta-cellobiosidase